MSATDLHPAFRRMLGLDKPEPAATSRTARPAEVVVGGDRYANAALNGELDRLATAQPGTRNHTLNRAAFSLAQLVEQGMLEESTVRNQLRHVALTVGLSEKETDLTLSSAFKGATVKPRPTVELVEVTDAPPVHILHIEEQGDGDQPDDEAAHTETVRRLFPTLDWHALWEDDTEEEWILEPVIPARRLIAIYSPPKVGKSLLLLEMAVGISRGVDTLGTTTTQRNVLYVDFENDPRGDVRSRLQAMGAKPDHLANLHYLSYPTIAKLDSERGGVELVTVAQAYGCDLIVIDTISRAVAGEENENDTWLNFYRHTGLLLKQAGIACVRLDHSGKDLEKGMRGGSAKYGDVDAVWRLSAVSEDTYRLDCTDHRLPIAEKCIVFKRTAAPYLRSEVQGEGRQAAWRAQDEAAVNLLDSLGLPDDTGRTRAREALKAAGLKVSNRALENAIRDRKRRLGIFEEDSE